jgi:putative redox protein
MIAVNAKIYAIAYSTTINYQTGSFISDEPLDSGGQNLGPSPIHLIASSLASCTAITLKMYCDRHHWLFEDIQVNVALEFVESNVKFIRSIIFNGAISDEHLNRLLNIANKCPVHKMLSGTIEINSKIHAV